jgi:hypothetical protein
MPTSAIGHISIAKKVDGRLISQAIGFRTPLPLPHHPVAYFRELEDVLVNAALPPGA